MRTSLFSRWLRASLIAATLASPALAMIELEDVPPARAKELGITLSSRPNGDAGTMITLTVKNEGPLETITWVELQFDVEGHKALHAPLEVRHPKEGISEFWFSLDPSLVAASRVMIVSRPPKTLGGTGYVLRIKELYDSQQETPEKPSPKPQAPPAPPARTGSDSPPASPLQGQTAPSPAR